MTTLTAYSANNGIIMSGRMNKSLFNATALRHISLKQQAENFRNKLNTIAGELVKDKENSLFQDVRPGDIVTVVKPWNIREFRKITANDRSESCVVVAKTEKGICTYPFMTNRTDNCKPGNPKSIAVHCENTESGKISLEKAGFCSARRIIDHIDHIPVSDQLRINMSLNMNEMPSETNPRFCLKMPVRINSVVNKGKDYYYIYSLSGKDSAAYRLTQSATAIPVNFNSTLWYVDYDEKLSLKIDDTYTVAGALTDSVRRQIVRRTRNITPGRKTMKKAAETDEFENTYRFSRAPGELVKNRSRSYIYMFSSKDKAYGFAAGEKGQKNPELLEIGCLSRIRYSGRFVPTKELRKLIKDFTSSKESYSWMNNLACAGALAY